MKTLTNRRGPFGFIALFFICCEALTASIYFHRQNFMNDIIWTLPLVVFFGVISFFALDYYYIYRELDKKNMRLIEK
jgi:hypothetical protein